MAVAGLPAARASLRRRVAVARWILPLILASIVVAYETYEHVLHGPEPLEPSFFAEVGFFGFLGPALVLLTLTWIVRNLAVQEAADAEIRRLNATLELQVADRTRSLEQAYRELEENNRELRNLDELKSEFVSLVSHELRAPLTNINGGIELMMTNPELSPNCRGTLGVISEQSQRLTRLVKNILDASVIEAGRWPLNPGPVAVSPLVQRTVRAIQPRAGRRQIEWHDTGGLLFAWADEDSLVQVLTNLLDNAIRYSPDGSTISIGIRAVDRMVHLSVSDKGPGIPPWLRERVFERYHRLEGRYDRRAYGHGLGLYVARWLVEAQEGRIWVEDGRDQGTRFEVALPRVPEEGIW